MKKVLVLSSTFPRWAGDTNPPFVYELSRRLASKLNITVLSSHYQGAKSYEVMGGLNVYRYRYFLSRFEKLIGGILPLLKKNKLYFFTIPFYLFFQILATIRLVKKYQPDIIHAHWIIPQGIAAYINFLINKTPYVITSHGSDLHTLGLIPLKRLILKNAKSITVVSNDLKNEIKKIDPELIKKTSVIPMGVDTEMFNPNKYDKSIKKKYNITGKLLLFVGRLAPEKGINFLIDAMPGVLKKYPKTKLLIIGGGVLENELKSKVKLLNIENNVIFFGPISHDKLPSFFATSDIFISPSLREGTPTTYLEAIASGIPLLCGDIPISHQLLPPSQIIKHNKDSISKHIVKIFQSKSGFKAKLDNKYRWDSIALQFSKIL